MMTHGPPMGILDTTRTGEHVGCQHLLRAARRCKPRLHCFGHIHEAWGARKIKWNESQELDVSLEKHVVESQEVLVDHGKTVEAKAARVDTSREGDVKIEYGKETLMINASIMTLRYDPWNSPWLVDVELEKAG